MSALSILLSEQHNIAAMVQGFTIPLLLGAATEALWGGVLLLPYPFHRPGVYLAKASYSPYVRIKRIRC